MDISSLLQNEQLKGLLGKFGLNEKQVSGALNMAVSTVKSKFEKEPAKVSSLLSDKPNTDEDHETAKGLENDFLGGLISKLGLPEGLVNGLKGQAMPQVINSLSGGLNASGKNSQDGIMGMLGGFLDKIDGDGVKNNGAGLFAKLKSWFGKK